jgi:hypothetical protein
MEKILFIFICTKPQKLKSNAWKKLRSYTFLDNQKNQIEIEYPQKAIFCCFHDTTKIEV